jgi:hypothetical protein
VLAGLGVEPRSGEHVSGARRRRAPSPRSGSRQARGPR